MSYKCNCGKIFSNRQDRTIHYANCRGILSNLQQELSRMKKEVKGYGINKVYPDKLISALEVAIEALDNLKHVNHHTIEEEMWRIDEAKDKITKLICGDK